MTIAGDKLKASLKEVGHSIEELALARIGVNDPGLNDQIAQFLSAARPIVQRQLLEIETTAADDLTSLLEGIRSIDVPAEIEDLGRPAGLTALRSVQGLVVMGLVRAIEDAAQMGLRPRVELVGALPAASSGNVSLSSALQGVVARIEALEASLDSLEIAQSYDRAFVQQSELTVQTVGVLRAETRLVRFLLNSPNPQTTIAGLVRTLSAMAERTGNFWATIAAWRQRVSSDFLQAAGGLRRAMTRTLRGARMAISWHNRRALRALSEQERKARSEEKHDTSSPLSADLFDIRRYGQRLLGNLSAADGYLALFAEELSRNPTEINPKDNVHWQRFALYNRLIERSDIPEFECRADDVPSLSEHERALAGVNYRARQVFLLSEIFTTPEIAKVLALPDEEVRLHLQEAAGQLAPALATRVLIIEPHGPTADRIANMAVELGHKVLPVAGTEAEAIEVAQAGHPGIILAEIQLRDGSSGIAAVNRILKMLPAPVIFVTAYPERFLTGARPEPAFLMAKPFDERYLAAVMTRALFFKRVASSAVRVARAWF
ncbi:hypothetical protein [Bradyrhizobium ottawaense]|uniref:hypothetical protein n=1 Tax=Bradyrhizobium ottawaense TaxID=931866 RepID=UPI003F9F44A8